MDDLNLWHLQTLFACSVAYKGGQCGANSNSGAAKRITTRSC